MIKTHGFDKNEEEPYKYKWIDSSMSVFLILYMDEILLIKNDILYIIGDKGFAIITILHKGLGKSILHPKDEDL